MNVHLGDGLNHFVEAMIATGEYQTQSEVLREGLRLLKEREELRSLRIEHLKKEIGIGIAQIEKGEYQTFNDRSLKKHFENIKSRGLSRKSVATKKSK